MLRPLFNLKKANFLTEDVLYSQISLRMWVAFGSVERSLTSSGLGPTRSRGGVVWTIRYFSSALLVKMFAQLSIYTEMHISNLA